MESGDSRDLNVPEINTGTQLSTSSEKRPFNPVTDALNLARKKEHGHVIKDNDETNSHDNNINSYNYVNHPSHYNNYDTEVLIMMERIWGKEAAALWSEMTAFKYRMRMGTKPGEPITRDIEKENFYLNEYSKRNPKHLPITVIIEDNDDNAPQRTRPIQMDIL